MYDIAIIGAGAAGVEAAKEALKYKLKVLLVDTDKNNFGGVCLNRGCIPAKYYLSQTVHNKDFPSIFLEKEKIVDSIKRPTIEYFTRRGIDIMWGEVSFISPDRITLSGKDIPVRNVIIATGSSPTSPIKVDNRQVIYAEEFFSLGELPSSFLIIGAGAVGLEIACILRNLQKRVIVLEKEDRILPMFGRSITSRLQRILEKKGIEFRLSAKEIKTHETDMVIVATGRRPRVDSLNLNRAGVRQNDRGWIETDDYLRTSIPSIYACGDVNGKGLYAYVAQRQGRLAVQNIVGETPVKEDWRGTATCVFTQPQLATVGRGEEELKTNNIKFKTIKGGFLRFSSSYVYSDTDGFIEVIAGEDNKILGATIISKVAAELISIFSLALRYNMSLDDISSLTFIHPTIAEIIPSIIREYKST